MAQAGWPVTPCPPISLAHCGGITTEPLRRQAPLPAVATHQRSGVSLSRGSTYLIPSIPVLSAGSRHLHGLLRESLVPSTMSFAVVSNSTTCEHGMGWLTRQLRGLCPELQAAHHSSIYNSYFVLGEPSKLCKHCHRCTVTSPSQGHQGSVPFIMYVMCMDVMQCSLRIPVCMSPS